MKKILMLLFALLLIGQSCEIAEMPYVEKPTSNGNGNGEEVVKKVLLEDFTGHQCPNCPAGTLIANQLHDMYGSRFITIAYHAGFFARTSPSFPIDYTTSEGNELRNFFNPTSYPSGLVNRRIFSGSPLLDRSFWASATANILQESAIIELKITKLFSNESRKLMVAVEAKSLIEQSPLKLCIFLTESGLISSQKTSNDPNYPSGTITNYEHKHVFRSSLNGAWGQNLFHFGATANETQTIVVVGDIDANWVTENMNIVCFAYSEATGEIIQVEEAKVIE